MVRGATWETQATPSITNGLSFNVSCEAGHVGLTRAACVEGYIDVLIGVVVRRFHLRSSKLLHDVTLSLSVARLFLIRD